MKVKLNSKPLSLGVFDGRVFLGTFDGTLYVLETVSNELKEVISIGQPISEIQFLELPNKPEGIIHDNKRLILNNLKGLVLADWHGTLHYFEYESNVLTKIHELFLKDEFIKSFVINGGLSFVGCGNCIYVIDNETYRIVKEIDLGNAKALIMKILPHNLSGCIICGLNNSNILIINLDFTYKFIETSHRQSITDIIFSKETIITCSLDGTIRKNFEEIIFNKKGYIFQYNEIGLIAKGNELIFKGRVIFEGKRNLAKFVLIDFVVYGICYDGCLFIIKLYNEEESSDI